MDKISYPNKDLDQNVDTGLSEEIPPEKLWESWYFTTF